MDRRAWTRAAARRRSLQRRISPPVQRYSSVHSVRGALGALDVLGVRGTSVAPGSSVPVLPVCVSCFDALRRPNGRASPSLEGLQAEGKSQAFSSPLSAVRPGRPARDAAWGVSNSRRLKGPAAEEKASGFRPLDYLQPQQQPFFWSMTWKASASAKTVTSGWS